MNKDTKNLWQWEQLIKQLLSDQWLECFAGYQRLIIAYSGGLDSTVLLHLIASHKLLASKSLVVHVNHKLSVHAELWQAHCKQQCAELGLAFESQEVAFDKSCNIEEGARTARYQVFSSLLTNKDCLLLAHHQDDQAETVLLQLFRGAGIQGLSAMSELSQLGGADLARPLLSYTRDQLHQYALDQGLKWVEDESNQSSQYARNFLRNELMPSIAQRWSGVSNALARAAQHCKQAQSNLEALALIDCPALSTKPNILDIEQITALSKDRIVNVLRLWLKQNQVQAPSSASFLRLIDEIIAADADAMPLVSWSDIEIRRYRNKLYLQKKHQVQVPQTISWEQFPGPLTDQTNAVYLTAIKAQQGLKVPQQAQIEVRFRIGGEVFTWHGQTKKLKKLVQEWGVPPWLRNKVPLIYINNELAAVVGYAVSDAFYSNSEGWLISMANNPHQPARNASIGLSLEAI